LQSPHCVNTTTLPGAELREALLEIRDQIGRVLEADMKADDGAVELAGAGSAGLEAGRRQGEALIAAPGRADAEEMEALDHPVRRLGAVLGLEDDAEQAAGAAEV